MFLLVTVSLLPELAADHLSEKNKEAKSSTTVGVTNKFDDPRQNKPDLNGCEFYYLRGCPPPP
ncbi:hypothetical protein FCM35_KLT17319 [Carex littledalei]|uniref:Uncharacterized protein n=1 Tax=Carex littledalei TaxID=544730 RepID=A0A833RFZ4_9POAL|nr:hypothetical protein FCM35_KLT17319 [Carex littledalei]